MTKLQSKRNNVSIASATEELDDVKEKLAKIELRQGGTKTKKRFKIFRIPCTAS